MSEFERRRHRRHRVRLSVQFLRGEAEVAGEIFNLSRSGCFLVTPVSLKPGERLDIQLPHIRHPRMSFQVVRTRPIGLWHAVAVAFEPHLPDEALLEELARSSPASDGEPEQFF
jgi:PilZ domain